jgi:hypothetical protein
LLVRSPPPLRGWLFLHWSKRMFRIGSVNFAPVVIFSTHLVGWFRVRCALELFDGTFGRAGWWL